MQKREFVTASFSSFTHWLRDSNVPASSNRVGHALRAHWFYPVSFPTPPLLGVEADPNSADVATAAERLRGCANVDCRFGDSIRLLPELVEPGDIVLID